jgi:hypothetical protein
MNCARPGEGIVIQTAPDLMGTPSHVKDNARWANALAHKQSPLLLPGASSDNLGITVFSSNGPSLTGAALNGSIGEPESFPAYANTSQFMPHDLHARTQTDDARNKQDARRNVSEKAASVLPHR